ncbi:MAG: hypothetical protein KDH94_06150, partial [Coxiellaceae bacterium]|nr:hypothetical protein [Coxiellaceae bacterium]
LPKERENQSQSAPEPTEKDNLGAVILGNFQGSRADRIKYLLEPQQRSKQGIETAYRLMLERFLADAKTQDHTEDTAYEVAKVILSYDGVKLSKVIETVAKGTQDASASSEIMINFLNNIVLVRLYADALDDIMSENSGAELPNIKKAIQRLAEFPDQKEKVAKQLKTIDFVKELYDSISHLDDAHKATALEKLKVAVEALKNSSACPHETVEAVVKFYYANQSDAAKRERRGLRRHLGTQLNNLNLRSKKDAAYDIQRDFLKWIGFAAENGDFSDHEEYFTSALELAGVHVLNARPLPYAQQHTIFSFALSYFQNQDTAKLNSSGFVKLISLFIQYGPKHDIELYKSFSKAHLLVLWKQLVTDALKLSADGEWDKAGFIFRTLNSIYTHCSSQHPDLSKADVDLLQVLITEKPSTLQASTLEKIQECIREILKIYDQTDDDGEISIQLLKVRDTLNALNTSFGSSTSNYPDRLYVLGLIGKLQDLIAQHQDKALDQLKNKERDLDKEKERKSEETLSVVNNPNTVWGKVASAKPVARLYTVEFIRKQDDFNDDDSDLPTNDL